MSNTVQSTESAVNATVCGYKEDIDDFGYMNKPSYTQHSNCQVEGPYGDCTNNFNIIVSQIEALISSEVGLLDGIAKQFTETDQTLYNAVFGNSESIADAAGSDNKQERAEHSVRGRGSF
jgi:hypothetical protein